MTATPPDKEYLSFRASVPLKVVAVGEGIQAVDWHVFDFGPRSVKCPLVLLPPACGNAELFYKQVVTLSSAGFRVISVSHPAVWTIDAWISSFSLLLDSLGVVQVHLFGASLGGFLAQKFAEATCAAQRVQSVILCNSFTDTAFFNSMLHIVYPYMPLFVLQRMLLGNMPQDNMDAAQAAGTDFVVEQLGTLSRDLLASRLCLNTESSYVEPQKIFLQNIKIMVIDVMDQSALSLPVKEEMAKMYPDARVAHLKCGGNFPYIANSDEVNMFIKLHLRPFQGSPFSACDDIPMPAAPALPPADASTPCQAAVPVTSLNAAAVLVDAKAPPRRALPKGLTPTLTSNARADSSDEDY